MFDDPKKELEALEKQLLADEAWFEKELDSAKRMIGQNPAAPQRAAAARTPQSPKPTAKPAPKAAAAKSAAQPQKKPEAPAPKKKSVKGLLILAGVETLGILGLIAYWVLFLLK